MLAAVPTGADAFNGTQDHGAKGFFRLLLGGDGNLHQVECAGGDGFRDFLRRLARCHHGIAHIEHHALPQHAGVLEGIHHDVGQRDLVLVDAVDAQQAADGTLHGHGRIAVGERLHVFGNRPRQLPGAVYLPLVQSKFAFIHIVVLL